jgi:hypothetical protein
MLGGIASAGINYFASGKAAKAQQAGYSNALSNYNLMLHNVGTYLEPYRDVGTGAMRSLASLYGIGADGSQDWSKAMGPDAYAAFERSPDYAYARKSAMDTLGFSNSASGLLRSSEHMRSALGLSHNLATQNFGNFRNSLMGLGQWGLDAGKTMASAAMGIGGQMGQAMMGQGNAQAAGIMGQAGALTSGINSLTNSLTQYDAFNSNKSAYGSGSAPSTFTGYGNHPMVMY